MAARPLPPPWRWWPVYVLVGAGAVVALLAAVRAVGELLSPVRHALFIVLFGIVLAFLLAPLVERLERLLGRRPLAVLVTVLLTLGAIVAVVTFTATPIVRELRDLAQLIPTYAAELSSDRPLSIAGVEIPGELRQQAGRFISEHGADLAEQSARVAIRASRRRDHAERIAARPRSRAGLPRTALWAGEHDPDRRGRRDAGPGSRARGTRPRVVGWRVSAACRGLATNDRAGIGRTTHRDRREG